MDFLDELESMAQNFDSVSRWQELFQYSYEEAARELQKFRMRPDDPQCVSDEEWEEVREAQEKIGHDRESYEYLKQQRRRTALQPNPPKKTAMFLFVLPEPLSTASEVQQMMNLASLPATLHGTDDDGRQINLCRIDSDTKARILEQFFPSIVESHFIVDSFAEKSLSADSKHPTLGIDSTMPQHRLSAVEPVLPQQDQYPVHYFFYGTLADPEYLSRLLCLTEPPEYHPAQVRGGQLTTWGGKYKALVDAEFGSASAVQGVAYKVKSKEDEVRLQYYETNKYEVVRVTIDMDVGGVLERIPGLTFRFIKSS